MSMSENKSVPRRTLTPLWVISLFVSLTEAVLAAAVTQTSGGVQVALTAFVLIFPLLIASGFFAILWFKPHHIYAPTEFGQQVGAREYIEAMTQRKSLDENQLYINIQKTIQSTLTSSEIITALTETLAHKEDKLVERDVARILDSAVDKTVENIREESFLTINSKPLLGKKGDIWHIPYDFFATISELLDYLWFKLEDMPAYAYGEKWVLRDRKTGHIFKGASSKYGREKDSRKLKEVGIMPGMELEVVLPDETSKV